MNRRSEVQLYPDDEPIPEYWAGPQLVLTPLTPAHLKLDYAALMASKEMLRLWSGSPWPQDTFALEDNLVDLERHSREHREREAFTYTVLSPEETECLGCVYIVSMASLARESIDTLAPGASIGDYEAAVRFWVTQPRLAENLDAALLKTLIEWFNSEWCFRRVFFSNRLKDRRQSDLFAGAGLRHAYTLEVPKRADTFQFWSFGNEG